MYILLVCIYTKSRKKETFFFLLVLVKSGYDDRSHECVNDIDNQEEGEGRRRERRKKEQ